MTESSTPQRQGRAAAALAFGRNTWRGLTSMRTALILLFLLAVAALPGALLPQYSLNAVKVAEYVKQYPTLGPILDDLGFFAVYGSPWFAAIYVLLFVSLIGCLLPRTVEYARQLRQQPVLVPRNLSRLPHHASTTVDGPVEEVLAATKGRLRGWRKIERTEDEGVATVSAERGFTREAGNLVFHFALVALLLGMAAGKLFGYEGQVIVLANGSQFCNSGIYAYDSFRPGLTVDGTELNPFCVRVDSMESRYFDDLQPDVYRAKVAYQDEHELSGTNWRTAELEVNSPVRLSGDRVYLLGTGYAPRFVVTFPGGEQRVGEVQWKPMDMVTLLSEGATKFDPPGVTDSEERRKKQLAITGLFAPTAGYHGSVLTSIFPAASDPAVAVDIYRGDLGNESGRGQSIFEIDKSMVDSGRLTKVLRKNLALGEEVTLDDGTKVRFDGVVPWVSLQVSSDPAQFAVLLAGLAVLVGLGLSLIIKRRRLWVRLSPAGDGRTLIEVGGLARTDQAGYGEEFTRVASELFAARGKDK
ncbi:MULTISPECIES: cytochrome c biogenesis protein ResB [unclassified Crossiella]|uniref:cytochrome c biogenesis protein ResB n=1 Tax=unclassified Crossiella TaxID=2620835 RepID=UPI001FFF6D50|nr:MULTISPECIES: cytochrome c biogenesis protein ResB [unclassified Crossiella]MCK2236744.1 cytochrome c biogenesis protein ResB [Crossiella sp. S99.2]MCK2250412.1 cytochrome c biogenesis protein ResB [Crossiella sp. S99.1]